MDNMRIGLVIYGSLDTLSGGYLYDRKLVDYLWHTETVSRSFPCPGEAIPAIWAIIFPQACCAGWQGYAWMCFFRMS
jgi:hypothetical protein